MASASKLLGYSEVSLHNTSEDCWVIVNSKVYNVTNFLASTLVAMKSYWNQQDASYEFEYVGHGSAARLMLDEFYVGEVDPSSHETRSNSMSSASSGHALELSRTSHWNRLIIVFCILLWLLQS